MHQVRIGWVKYTHKVCELATLCYYISFVWYKHRRWSASYVVGCCWLLAAVFVAAASTPHRSAFEAGGTLSG